MLSLQEIVEPHGTCFGCGQGNPKGLRIRSYPDPDGVHVLATMMPEDFHCGWPGLVYGGYLAMIADCHCNWTSIYAHYTAEGRVPGSDPQITCATASLLLKYRKPTPMGAPLLLRARVEGEVRRMTRILCDIIADDIVTVEVDATFARVDTRRLAKAAHI